MQTKLDPASPPCLADSTEPVPQYIIWQLKKDPSKGRGPIRTSGRLKTTTDIYWFNMPPLSAEVGQRNRPGRTGTCSQPLPGFSCAAQRSWRPTRRGAAPFPDCYPRPPADPSPRSHCLSSGPLPLLTPIAPPAIAKRSIQRNPPLDRTPMLATTLCEVCFNGALFGLVAGGEWIRKPSLHKWPSFSLIKPCS